jgi:hypothetical protein
MKSKKTLTRSSSKVNMSRDMTSSSNSQLPPILASMPESQEDSCRSRVMNMPSDAGSSGGEANHSHASSKLSLPRLNIPVVDTGKPQRQFNR